MSRLCARMSNPPGNVGNGVYDRGAERVTSNLQHAPCNEQKEQEDAAHAQGQVHPHTLPVERKGGGMEE